MRYLTPQIPAINPLFECSSSLRGIALSTTQSQVPRIGGPSLQKGDDMINAQLLAQSSTVTTMVFLYGFHVGNVFMGKVAAIPFLSRKPAMGSCTLFFWVSLIPFAIMFFSRFRVRKMPLADRIFALKILGSPVYLIPPSVVLSFTSRYFLTLLRLIFLPQRSMTHFASGIEPASECPVYAKHFKGFNVFASCTKFMPLWIGRAWRTLSGSTCSVFAIGTRNASCSYFIPCGSGVIEEMKGLNLFALYASLMTFCPRLSFFSLGFCGRGLSAQFTRALKAAWLGTGSIKHRNWLKGFALGTSSVSFWPSGLILLCLKTAWDMFARLTFRAPTILLLTAFVEHLKRLNFAASGAAFYSGVCGIIAHDDHSEIVVVHATGVTSTASRFDSYYSINPQIRGT